MNIVHEQIDEALSKYGSWRSAACELGLSLQYLYDVRRNKRKPGPKVLKALGLKKEVRIVRANGASEK